MPRRKKHEEHVNAEAWAIPYGDLVTLLMALFVVLYATASVNEGKYRVVADSLTRAFKGTPRSIQPIQFGKVQQGGVQKSSKPTILHTAVMDAGVKAAIRQNNNAELGPVAVKSKLAQMHDRPVEEPRNEKLKLQKMADDVERALKDYIDRRLIVVRRTDFWLEVEISTDILFSSGSANIAGPARPILSSVAQILAPFPNAIRIEGHTDNVPIATAVFPSNWELSAARAASVVHLFDGAGVDPRRMSVLGYGEYRPRFDNSLAEGRDANRRVIVVVMAMPAAEAEQAPQTYGSSQELAQVSTSTEASELPAAQSLQDTESEPAAGAASLAAAP